MVQLGVRIELYESVGPLDEPSRNYLAALSRDDGHEGATVPAVGDHLSTMTLRAGTLEAVPQLRGDAGAFLRVRRIEHVLRPVRDGKTATWSGWDTPVTVLVLHSPYDVPTDPHDTTWTADLLRRYAATPPTAGPWTSTRAARCIPRTRPSAPPGTRPRSLRRRDRRDAADDAGRRRRAPAVGGRRVVCPP
ncbi:hypothetical protein ABIA38_005531 [Embleya sp. AB8]